jgi:hypothetical protein
MSHKVEMLNLLVQAGQMLSEQVSSQEVLRSNLGRAWVQQVGSALAAIGMERESALWQDARRLEVTLTSEEELSIYLMSMRAILLGMLHRAEVGDFSDPQG